MAKITTANTKAQILQAYEEILKEVKRERSQNTALQRELSKKEKLVEEARAHSKQGAGRTIKMLRETFNEQIDKIEQGLEQEQQKFLSLQEAIELEKKTLQESYDIRAEMDSLEALSLTHRQAKEKFEADMKERRAALEEEMSSTKRIWEREKEAYEFNLMVQRRNESDTYQQERAKLEKELKERKEQFDKKTEEREKVLAEREGEWKQLQKDVAAFEKRLSDELAKREEEVKTRVTRDLEYKYHIESKDLEAELKLAKQEIAILKTNLADQQSLLEALQAKIDSAGGQVRDIALKAIENAGIKSVNFPTDRSKEDSKST